LRQDRPILLANPGSTRGLSAARLPDESVKAVEYYDRGVLKWWRLERYG
jgi:hypothetical protein